MGEQSRIEWTDHTWSPWEGCQKVGPGCDNCYAEARNARFHGGTAKHWGPGAERRLTAMSGWRKPLIWNEQNEHAPRRTRVFPSLCDPFDNAVDPLWRRDLFRLIDATPNLEWLLLTKRIQNVTRMVWDRWADRIPENVRIGATMVNQEEVDRDWAKLAAVPTDRIFVSIEPMLGPIVLPAALLRRKPWIIVGGESGPHARPMHADWPVGILKQCDEYGAPFMFKQWGEYRPVFVDTLTTIGFEYEKVGKAAAGRRLHGVEHNGFPA